METITMASGKILQVDMVATIPSPPYAYIRVLNVNRETVQRIFSDPEETKTMVYNGVSLTGYTKLGYICEEGKSIKVRMER